MSNAMIYIGITIVVLAMAGAVTYGTQNQQNYIPDDVIPDPQQNKDLSHPLQV